MVGVGDLEVLQRRGVPLRVVAVQELPRCPAAQHEGQLPGRVLGVRRPRVQAPGPEGGQQVGAIAGEQYPADAKRGARAWNR